MTLSDSDSATQNQEETTTSTSSSSPLSSSDLPITHKEVNLRTASTGIRLTRKPSSELKKTVRFALADDEDVEEEEKPGKEKKVFGKEVFERKPQDQPTTSSSSPMPTMVDEEVVPRRTWLNPEERHKYVRKSLALHQSSPSLITQLTESPGPVSSETRRRTGRPATIQPSSLRKSSNACVERKTWIEGSMPGQIEIKEDVVMQTKVLHPDTIEMAWLKKKFGWLLINGPLADLIGFVMVAPLTNVTCFSLYYQLYLNEIFHTNILTRLGHFIFMPITYFFLFAFAAQFNLFEMDYHLDVSFLALKPLTVPFLMGLSFIVWHLAWGILSKTYLLGVFMLPVTIGVYLSANYYVAYFGVADEFADPETRFLATVWYAAPLFWLAMSGLLQACSHLFEKFLPPRMNLTARWLTWPEFVRINCPNKSKFVAWFLTTAVCGLFDEIVASPRLLPLYVLHIFFLLGYHSDEFAKIKALAKSAMVYNNPALDFIGTGGALQPSAGDYVYEKKPEDIQADLAAAAAPARAAPVPLSVAATAPAPPAMLNAVASITSAPAFRTIKRRSRSGSFTG